VEPEIAAANDASTEVGLSPQTFRRFTYPALASQMLIVLTGAIVRLTESGLGCSDWPTCEQDQLIPEIEGHAWIEFGNRLLAFLVTVAAVAVLIAARRRVGDRKDLVRLSWGLAAGTVGQIVLGGIVVLSDLNPWLVLGHFVLSMILIWDALLLVHRSTIDDDVHAGASMQSYRPQAWLITALAAVAIFVGTLVTGSGPHTGSSDGDPITRLPFSIRSITRVHSTSVVILITVTVATAWWLRSVGGRPTERRRLSAAIAIMLAQGAVGYVQYFTGVPAVLVAVHVAGAISVWAAVIWFHLSTAADPVNAADVVRGRSAFSPLGAATKGSIVTAASGVNASPTSDMPA